MPRTVCDDADGAVSKKRTNDSWHGSLADAADGATMTESELVGCRRPAHDGVGKSARSGRIFLTLPSDFLD
jgi:hypothetical protein